MIRTVLVSLLVLTATACTTARPVQPREYLDETTAATITVVAEPWIFTRANVTPGLDCFNLYAVDVNTQGDHKKYIVVVHYWPEQIIASGVSPKLELRGGERELTLEALEKEPRSFGVAEPIDKTAPPSAKYWFYPVDKGNLDNIARSRQMSAALITAATRMNYVAWRDGAMQLSEFAGVALDQ
jgi:hypothetical protein